MSHGRHGAAQAEPRFALGGRARAVMVALAALMLLTGLVLTPATAIAIDASAAAGLDDSSRPGPPTATWSATWTAPTTPPPTTPPPTTSIAPPATLGTAATTPPAATTAAAVDDRHADDDRCPDRRRSGRC